jgi:hypothetical protein
VASFINPAVQLPSPYLPSKDDKKEEPLVENLEFVKWVANDQQVLSYLLMSLS